LNLYVKSTALLQAVQAYPALLIGIYVVLGLIAGSFLNVAIHRLPKMLTREQCTKQNGTSTAKHEAFNLFVPRSKCPKCQHGITALENIPLIGFFILRGKCVTCKTKISRHYPIVEALSGIISGVIAWKFGFSVAAAAALVFTWAIIALTFIDIDTQLLPDYITLPLLWAGLLFNSSNVFTSLNSAVIGAVAGYLSLWSIYWLFKLATKKRAIGFGDFKLLAAIGAWLGWKLLPLVILLSSLAGAAVGATLIIIGRNSRHTPISFGPYLALAGLVALFCGDSIVSAYLRGF